MYRKTPLFLLISLSMFALPVFSDGLSERDDVRQFIQEMVDEHDFEREALTHHFASAKIANSILKAISRPAEAKPWYKYRKIFLTSDRIKQGAKFLEENYETLKRAESIYGVPVEIIVAIIGVETRYGRHAGKYKVLDSLSTLAFEYPKRSKFFRSELKEFFLLAREQGLNPLDVKGSYAGAMGIPQFISSSYRNFAVDFDDDGKIDIWDNPVDAIGSVGNYFKKHGWQAGEEVAVKARVEGDAYLAVLSKGLEPHINTSELYEYGISSDSMIVEDSEIKFLEYELDKGSEFWIGYKNFYVITRYNHSSLYAMAVYQLAGEIADKYKEAQARD